MSCIHYCIHSSFLPGSQKWLHMLHLFIDCDQITTFHPNYGSGKKKLPFKRNIFILVTFQPTFQFSTICWPLCTYVYLKRYWMFLVNSWPFLYQCHQAIFLLLGIAFFIYMVQNRNYEKSKVQNTFMFTSNVSDDPSVTSVSGFCRNISITDAQIMVNNFSSFPFFFLFMVMSLSPLAFCPSAMTEC